MEKFLLTGCGSGFGRELGKRCWWGSGAWFVVGVWWIIAPFGNAVPSQVLGWNNLGRVALDIRFNPAENWVIRSWPDTLADTLLETSPDLGGSKKARSAGNAVAGWSASGLTPVPCPTWICQLSPMER